MEELLATLQICHRTLIKNLRLEAVYYRLPSYLIKLQTLEHALNKEFSKE